MTDEDETSLKSEAKWMSQCVRTVGCVMKADAESMKVITL